MMKKFKYIFFMLIFVFMFGIQAYASNIETTPAEESATTGTGTVTIQGYVDDEIWENEYSCFVAIIEINTGNTPEGYLYAANNYALTLNDVAAGQYVLDIRTGVVGDSTSRYPVKQQGIEDLDPNARYSIEVIPGGVTEVHLAFGDATFENIIRETEPASTEAETIPETTAAETVAETEPATEAPAETEAATEPAEESGSSTNPVMLIVCGVFLVVLVVAYIRIKMKNKKN